ncbi:pyridoxal-phosphate dependent enzyme [Gemmiger formicilis]|uniref:PLP-dependent cysteine synthase family protein n=1 Tax=Gemmiger formicilis TaxID=745368 RepID=UPI00195A380C|nr:pyridoxal-phosphate dependent enzyme [Gemmiger formicilis]MBM6914830.1 pyridoxal-phosphate dependent enzyme [Gemmiger formicilis]
MEVLNSYYPVLYRCPVVKLGGYAAQNRLRGEILVYLDFGGATGSAKDGLAESMLALATERGDLAPGQTVVEASSGTFGAALALACRVSGHPITLIVSRTLDAERMSYLRGLGAKLLYSSPLDGRRGMEQLARQTAESCGGYYMDYFANDDNPEHHRRVTGPAILKATGGQIDAVVAGVGSGGTVTGVGEHIRAWHDHIKIVAVEPYESQAIGGGFVGKHGIPGLGAGFVPANYNPYVVDLVMAVTSGDAQRAAREVLLTDGIPACPSAGAVLFAARQLIEKGKARRPLCIFSGRVTYD